MDEATPGPEPADDRDAHGATVDRIERQLLALDAMCACGVELAQVLTAEAKAGKLTATEATAAFDRLAKSMRRTVALQLRIVEDAAKTPAERAAERAADLERREAAAALAMGRAASAPWASDQTDGPKDDGPKTDRENLIERPERLNDWDVDDDLNGKTYGEILAGVGKDFGIEPDLGAFSAEELGRVYVRSQQTRADLARRLAMLASRAGGFARRPRVGDGRPRAMTAAPLPPQRPPSQRPPGAAGRTGPP